MENQLQIAFECGFAPKSDCKSILGAFLPPFYPLGGASGRSWVTLGDPWGSLGRPWGAPGVPWEGLGLPPGLPGDPPGRLRGPPWAPRGLQASKTTKIDDSCRDSRCYIVNPYNCRHFCGVRGRFLPSKPPKLMTVVGIHDAASCSAWTLQNHQN